MAEDRLWIVSRFIEGSPLDLRLRDGGPLPSPEAVVLVVELAEALQLRTGVGSSMATSSFPNILIDASGRPYLVEFEWPILASMADRNDLGLGVPSWARCLTSHRSRSAPGPVPSTPVAMCTPWESSSMSS